jgi:hypothetical protein
MTAYHYTQLMAYDEFYPPTPVKLTIEQYKGYFFEAHTYMGCSVIQIFRRGCISPWMTTTSGLSMKKMLIRACQCVNEYGKE